VDIGDDRSTVAVMKRNEEKSFAQDDTHSGYNRVSVNDQETVPRRGITSGDVMTGEMENRCDRMCAVDDAAVKDYTPRTLAGETESIVTLLVCHWCSFEVSCMFVI